MTFYLVGDRVEVLGEDALLLSRELRLPLSQWQGIGGSVALVTFDLARLDYYRQRVTAFGQGCVVLRIK